MGCILKDEHSAALTLRRFMQAENSRVQNIHQATVADWGYGLCTPIGYISKRAFTTGTVGQNPVQRKQAMSVEASTALYATYIIIATINEASSAAWSSTWRELAD